MTTRAAPPRRPPIEALLYCVVVGGALGPVVAHTLWRPLTSALSIDHTGLAGAVSVAAMVVGLLATVATAYGRGHRLIWPLTLGLAAGLGLVVGGGAAAAIALLVTAAATLWATPRVLAGLPTLQMTGIRRVIGLAVGCGFGGLAIVSTTALSTFMADVAYIAYALPPGIEFYHTHYCMTAYAHAIELLRVGITDVYDTALTPLGVSAAELETAAHMAPFTVDRYGYPPQYLLVPAALDRLVPDFAGQRAAWFGLNGLLFALTLWTVPRWVGPAGARVAMLAAPILWCLALVPLQSGNAHLAVVSVALLGMHAIDQRRESLGGGLLAAATLAKISPGLLGVLLLVRRRWRAAALTALWAAAFSGLAVLVFGWGPFEAFIEGHLPRIRSGEAYDFLDDDLLTIATNWSPFGMPFKLDVLGVPIDPWRWGPRVGTVFTALIFVAAAVAGRRVGDRRSAAAIWLAVLTLAGLRSPMAAGYVVLTGIWAMTLLTPELRGGRAWAAWIGALAMISWQFTVPEVDPNAIGPGIIGMSLASNIFLAALMIWLLVRRWPALDEGPGGGADVVEQGASAEPATVAA